MCLETVITHVCEYCHHICACTPQLIYPITVAATAGGHPRQEAAAAAVLHTLNQQDPTLVKEALLVSREMVKVAVTQVLLVVYMHL